MLCSGNDDADWFKESLDYDNKNGLVVKRQDNNAGEDKTALNFATRRPFKMLLVSLAALWGTTATEKHPDE